MGLKLPLVLNAGQSEQLQTSDYIIGNYDPLVQAYAALGSSIKGGVIGVNYQAEGSFNTFSFTDNQIIYALAHVEIPGTITGFMFYQRTAGVFTADNTNHGALATYAGGTMTQVAVSANNANLWKGTANTWRTEPFVTPYVAARGFYYIAILANWSGSPGTVPVISAGRALNQSNEATMDFTNSATMFGRKTGNSIPSSQTMSGLDAPTQVRPAIFLY